MSVTAERLISPSIGNVERPKPSIMISNSVSEAFFAYVGVSDNELDKARAKAKLRKILRQAVEINPKIKPKYLSGRDGKKPVYFSHRKKPSIVYLGYKENDVRFFEKVIFYDKNGRPSFRQA